MAPDCRSGLLKWGTWVQILPCPPEVIMIDPKIKKTINIVADGLIEIVNPDYVEELRREIELLKKRRPKTIVMHKKRDELY